nr:hypothetical protein [Leptospira interrogans]
MNPTEPTITTPKLSLPLGTAVRDKRTGRKLFVDLAWSSEVRCIYFDVETETLVKVDVPPEVPVRLC